MVQKFLKHKRIYRIITECRNRHSCRDFFKNLKIRPPHSQYILSLLLFVVNNTNKFKLNSDIHHINTKQQCNFHQLSSSLSLFQKGVCSNGIRVFSISCKVSKM
jgi:hypothetical protein